MKEEEYVRAKNIAKLEGAMWLVREMLPGKEYGVTRDELAHAAQTLEALYDKAHRGLTLEAEPAAPPARTPRAAPGPREDA